MIKEELFRFAKFTGSSLIGGTVDMVLVWLLSRYVFKGYWGDVIIEFYTRDWVHNSIPEIVL